ncbi:hypothetical protein HMPREF2134_01850 [Peptoniphilus lacrimalis DNF00528]|nr:hypothetical protein HMPREF2134_01850 [Peptoniphilus lacrimalis DNF00528]
MGKKLDSLVDLVISKNDDYSNLEDGNKLLVKKKLKSEILYEIKQEVKENAIEEAKKDIDDYMTKKKLKDYKELTILGLTIAFIIGLSVNQFTEVIGFYKKLIDNEPCVSITFAIIIAVIAIYLIFKHILKEIDNLSDNKKV